MSLWETILSPFKAILSPAPKQKIPVYQNSNPDDDRPFPDQPPSSTISESSNPVKTPEASEWGDGSTPKGRDLTPKERKERRVSFRKGFELAGNLASGKKRSKTKKEPKKIKITAFEGKLEKALAAAPPVVPSLKATKPVVQPSPKATKPLVQKKKQASAKSTTPSAVVVSSSTAAAKPSSSKKSSSTPPKLKKVKIESLRRGLRTVNKKGFYNMKRLESIAWKGVGTGADPITIDE
jgi:hypothetical protein